MSRIHGRRGRLYVGLASGSAVASPVTFLNSWSINFTTDKVEVTAFGDDNRTYVSGLPDTQGDFAGWYDTDTAQLYTAASDGDARKFYLYPDTDDAGDYWFGTAIFDFSVSGRVDNAADVSGSFAAASKVSQVKD